MRVLVTGASGYFGRQVLPALLEDPRVSDVVATDLAPPSAEHPRVSFARGDLDAAVRLLDGVDAVIHLAFRVERRPGEDVATTNVEANQRFLTAAAGRVETLVAASSVAAYGLRDAPFDRLRETDPIASDGGFYYAAHKIAAERLLDALEPGARARIVRARPSVVVGPTVDPRRVMQFKGAVQLIPRTAHVPRIQLLHELDLGSAFRTLLFAPAGAYNVAPDDALGLADAARAVGQRPLHVPYWVQALACDVTWRLGANALDPAWAALAHHPPFVADNTKLRSLGWTPRFGTLEALRDTVSALRQEALR